jgi:hypothetical protein
VWVGLLVFVERLVVETSSILCCNFGLHGTMKHRGQVPKRPKGADCKSAGLCLPRFESLPAHQTALAWANESMSGQAGKSYSDKQLVKGFWLLRERAKRVGNEEAGVAQW